MLIIGRLRLLTAGLLIGVLAFVVYVSITPSSSGVLPVDYFSSQSSYRRRLSNVRPLDRVTHSPHLGVFSKIYVVNLPRRADRRSRMERLAYALDVDFQYWNATDSEDEISTTLLERRRHRLKHEAETPKARNSTGDSKASTLRKGKAIWPADVLAHHDDPLAWPLGMEFADVWALPASDPRSSAVNDPIPPPPEPDTRPAIPSADAIEGMTGELSMEEIKKLTAWRVLSRGMVACWYSHVQLLREIAEGTGEATLILEDDVDMEWDIEARLRRMWIALPWDWDVVFLGHCWSAETTHPPLPEAPMLHRSFKPKCNHAYAVSRRGAHRLIRHLRAPAFAYSRALDQAYAYLVQSKRINAFSVYPSIIIQTKDVPSDIFAGNGSTWSDYLVDSTLERIRMLDEVDGT